MAVAVAFLISNEVSAESTEPTPIGQGQYMLAHKNFTVFGSSDKIIVKLMEQAQEFCRSKEGKEAVLLQTGGDDAEPAQFRNGQLQRPAKGASGTIYFQCGAPETDATKQTDKYDALAKLKSLLDSGAITKEEFEAQKKKILGD